MISIIKDLFSNQVGSAVILTIIGAITKKYIQFHRRDFFSRSSSEQIKAVEWLRTSSVPISDPLAKAEQQFRLQSFGLHRDWHLSYKNHMLEFRLCTVINSVLEGSLALSGHVHNY